MSYLLQNLGIVVTSFSENVGHLDAISHIPVLANNGESKRFYFTTYNTDKTTPARLNFTLAHELGHWILGHIVSDVKSQADAEYRSNESDANQFASAFLLPKEAFLKDLQYPTVLNEYLRLKGAPTRTHPAKSHRQQRYVQQGVPQSRVPIKQYLQKFPKWGRFGVTSVTPFLLLPVHPEGCTPARRT